MIDFNLECKPDAAKALERMEAFWHCEIIDRPAMRVFAGKDGPHTEFPTKTYSSLKERWLDIEYKVDHFAATFKDAVWGAETIPVFFPNLGPEISAAAFGAELEFGENTTWSIPMLENWADIPKLKSDPNNKYYKRIIEATKYALEVANGQFIVGLTDIHPGGDLCAAFRDPQQLCYDLLDEPEQVMALAKQVRPVFKEQYNYQYELMLNAGQTITSTWCPLYTDGKFYVPSNDFSCMISTDMFKEFFLDEIIEEIEWLDKSIYHLDGPNALKHLDTLLDIPKLNAIQWVYGAGNGRSSDWIPVYQRIQQAKKGIEMAVELDELDTIMENLDPRGVFMHIYPGSEQGVYDVIKRVSRWTAKGKF